jgi:hypothetical protein
MYVGDQQGDGVAYAVHVPVTLTPLSVPFAGGRESSMSAHIMYAATRFVVEGAPGQVRLTVP